MRDPAVIRYIRAQPLDRGSAIEQHEHSLAEWELYGFGKRAIIEAGHILAGSDSSSCRSSGPARARATTTSRSATSCAPTAGGRASPPRRRSASRDEAFGRCGLDELIGRCRVENVASARVLAKVGFRQLRLFELDDGIMVDIYRLQRAHWTPPPGHRSSLVRASGPATGAEYRETG